MQKPVNVMAKLLISFTSSTLSLVCYLSNIKHAKQKHKKDHFTERTHSCVLPSCVIRALTRQMCIYSVELSFLSRPSLASLIFVSFCLFLFLLSSVLLLCFITLSKINIIYFRTFPNSTYGLV